MAWTKKGKLRELRELDLAPIRKLLMEKEGWEERRTLEAEVMYKRFLSLMILFPGETISPTEEIDAFWHMHVLDTRKYLADCKRVFGKVIHHDPHLTKGSRGQVRAWERTLALYRRAYPREAKAADEARAKAAARGTAAKPANGGSDAGGCAALMAAAVAACSATSCGGASDGGGGASCGGGSSCGGASCGGGGCGGGGCGGA